MTVAAASACAKDETPPVIQNLQVPQYTVEGGKTVIEIETYDNRGTENVDVYLNNELIGTLTKKDIDKTEGEKTSWEGSFELPVGNDSVSIVAVDNAGNKSETKEDKITVYSKNSLYGYAQDKGIDNYLPQLVGLENNGILNEYGQAFTDLVVKYPKAGEFVPGIYTDILKLPDLSMEKYSKIDEKDIKAVEKILALASDPKYTPAFLSIDSVGIKDKREYDAAEEALLWAAFDNKNLSDFLEPYSLEKLIKDAWTNTSTSRNYSKDRWGDYDEVVARLNFPEGAYWYTEKNFIFELQPIYNWSSSKVFLNKRVGDCSEFATFVVNCLLEGGGYYLDKFEKTPETVYSPDDEVKIHETNAACLVSAVLFDGDGTVSMLSHDTPAVKIDGKIQNYDATDWWTNKGPFNSVSDMIEANTSIKFYVGIIGDGQPWRMDGLVLSEDFKKKMLDKSFKKNVMSQLLSSPYNSKENIENNKWAIEYLDNL